MLGALSASPATLEAIATSIKSLLGPDGAAWLSAIFWHGVWPVISQPSFHWLYLLSSLLLAAIYLVVTSPPAQRGAAALWRQLFPRAVFGHASAKVDYRFFIVNHLVIAHLKLSTWVAGLFGLLYVQQGVQGLFGWLLPAPDAGQRPGVAALVVFTLAMGLAFDFARYQSHRLHHRIPALWEFHKVHHSAEVLTVFTNYRNHPIETVVELLLRMIATALVAGVFGAFYPAGLVEYTVINYGALTFVYYLTAHLRHSHVPFDFGPLRTVLISPRMHQLHHSAEQRHFDKNFGFMFSFWDRLAGTLYLPARDEHFTLGLPPEAGRFDSVWNLYVQPFIACYRMVFPRPVSVATAAARPALDEPSR
jgi:sterol desaturase/sphingolipid hydroxylase (fatty acid hydroxylase superfamily)